MREAPPNTPPPSIGLAVLRRGAGGWSLTASVQSNLHLLEGGESLSDGVVDDGEEVLDLFFRIHNLNDDREVGGEPEDFCGVYTTVRAETLQTAYDGCTGRSMFARLPDNPLVKRPSRAREKVS